MKLIVPNDMFPDSTENETENEQGLLMNKTGYFILRTRLVCITNEAHSINGQSKQHSEQPLIEQKKKKVSSMIKVQIVNRGKQQLPAYATSQSAGMDLRADLEVPVVLHPMERRLIPTGLYIALPEGFEAQIRPRSGLALKHGITVLNTPGTVDADYRGEIMVLLINFSTENFTINGGERIAQMVIARHEQTEMIEVERLNETERGAGGYGHTGVK